MRVLLANPHGFCGGVEMAVQSLEQSQALFGTPLYAFHVIIHNQLVVQRFRRRGVVFVDDINEVPEGSHLLFSAHGVSPDVRRQARQRRLRTIDATCPLVAKVHREANDFAAQGYTIILIGHAGHDEAVGTLGEAPDQILLVETEDDVDRLELDARHKVAYLTQTTLSVDEANRIIARLEQRFPDIIGPKKEDICYATQNRQQAVRALLSRADVVLVLGSKNSSNSNRLAEIARDHGKTTYLVDDAAGIEVGWFQRDQTVVVTAGASTPEDVVEQCVSFLREHFQAQIEDQPGIEEHVSFPLPLEVCGEQNGQATVEPPVV